MTKKDLFLKLAQPDKDGFSKWVDVSKFTGEYKDLQLGNGGSWCRGSSSLAKEYIIEFDKTISSGNKIDRIRLNGKNTYHTFSQHIRPDIKKEISSKRCIILGTHRSCDHVTEVDHKDGRKNDPKVMTPETQKISDFQPLSKPANDAKRQFCIECKTTGKRYDAKKLGYSVSFVEGDENYNEEIGCKGCFRYDPIEFRQKLIFPGKTE